MHEARKILRLPTALCLVVFILMGCSADVTDPDDYEEGGVIGTGLILRGTVTDVRAFASNSLQIRARSGEISNAVIDDTGRYRAPAVKGAPPYLLRADLGNDEYRYGVAYDNERANVHSYSDVILRNWFESSNGDIDFEFDQQVLTTTLPSRAQFENNANEFFALAKLVLESYGVTGDELLTGDFNAGGNNSIDQYLRSNPVLIQGDNISLVLTDPSTETQSATSTGFSVFELADDPDTESPETPKSVRALGSASNEIIIVWEPSFDNRGVVGYDVFRDGTLVATTPYPVYIDKELQADSLYTYEVAAIDGAENTSATSLPVTSGTLAEIDNTAPPAPVQLSVKPELGRMELLWGQSNIGDVVSFEVYRGRNGGPIEFLTSVTSSFMTDITISSGVDYCYQVSAMDASGNLSPKSAEDCKKAKGEQLSRSDNQPLSQVAPLAGLTIPNVELMDCAIDWVEFEIMTSVQVDAGCYVVDKLITVNNKGALSLAPGVVLKFGPGAGVLVNTGGSFGAEGTKASPVVLTAQDPTPGYWVGIQYISSNSSRNKLMNTVVEYAGGGTGTAAVELKSNIAAVSRADISTTVIRSCTGAGVRAAGEFSRLNKLDGSVITGCDIPLVVNIDGIDGITQRNNFTGNVSDVVDLGEARVESDIQLKSLGVPYVATNIRVLSGNLKVLEGVEIRVRAGGEIYVTSTLTSEGSEDRRVLFTGTDQERGHWVGVVVDGIVDLGYADIRYGGARSSYFETQGALLVASGSLSLNKVRVDHSAEHAINFHGQSGRITSINSLVLNANRQLARVPIADAGKLANQLELLQNDSNVVELIGSQSSTENIEIFDLDASYLLTENFTAKGGNIKIHPDVKIYMKNGVSIRILLQASISAVGTLDKPITLTNESQIAGAWEGITVDSNSRENRIEHAVISFAGGSVERAPAAIKLSCNPSAYLFVGSTSIEDSAGWGIVSNDLLGCGVTLGENVQFLRNQTGAVGVY